MLLFLDGFTHYNAANLAAHAKWDGAISVSIGNSEPRRPGIKHAVGIDTGTYYSILSKLLPSVNQWIAVGCAFKSSSLISTYGIIHLLYDSTTQIAVKLNTDGSFSVHRGGYPGTELDRSASGLVYANGWWYLEARVNAATEGSYEIYLNGVPILSGAANCQAHGSSGVNAVAIRIPGYNGYVTDVYIDDETAHGDCRIDTVLPNAAGNWAQFEPVTGLNYANVDDPGAIDEDTSYNASNTLNRKDSFVLPDLDPLVGSTILGVQAVVTARKDDAGSRVLTPMMRTENGDYPHADSVIVGDLWRAYRWLYHEHPELTPWTEENFNAIEAGYKLIS